MVSAWSRLALHLGQLLRHVVLVGKVGKSGRWIEGVIVESMKIVFNFGERS